MYQNSSCVSSIVTLILLWVLLRRVTHNCPEFRRSCEVYHKRSFVRRSPAVSIIREPIEKLLDAGVRRDCEMLREGVCRGLLTQQDYGSPGSCNQGALLSRGY